MKFSIIVPIYNVEEYLERCVESLINQTYKNIEIILVDDGSLDSCPQKCDEYGKSDSRIVVIHKKNGGLSEARNEGLEHATGDYILFVDSDDYIDKDTCERFSKYANKNVDIIVADAIVEGAEENLIHIESDKIMTGEQFLLESYRENKAPMAAWLNIFKRSFLLNNQLVFKNGILHEDEEFTPRALLKANTVIVSGELFYHYIVRANSITTKKDKRKNAIDLFDTCKELEIVYKNIKNSELKNFLLNSLTDKYLSLFQKGELYKYGSSYYHKIFIIRNAKKWRTKMKGMIYFISPKLYYKINCFFKGEKND